MLGLVGRSTRRSSSLPPSRLDVHDFNLPNNKTAASDPEPEVKPVRPPINLPVTPTAPQVTHVATVADLVRKLKAAMTAENYTELHITESGVQFKRVQVTEGTLDV